jgi:RimJ/RimL family protein N-acetyltransferase
MKLIPIPESCECPPEIMPTFLVDEMLSTYTTYYPKIGFHAPWIGYFIVEDGNAVGSCGFTGAPKDNKVEIAYFTFPGHEGRGIATFACKELVKLALSTNSTLTIFAKTAPEENASTHILVRNGFVKKGETTDDEIGLAWEWVFALMHGLAH